jgi:serine/threonine-protein kinase PknG
MTTCPRAGCGGTLDEDGFCDTCGLEAPAGTPAAPPPPPPPTPLLPEARTSAPGL